MCGIVGYVGKNNAVPVILSGLYKLEYRGYDSAGIAVIENDNLKVIKTKGRIKDLDAKIQNYGEILKRERVVDLCEIRGCVYV